MKKKIFSFILIAILGFSWKVVYAQGFGIKELFNNGWNFHLGNIQYGGKEFLDVSEWRKLDLPHDWSIESRPNPNLYSCTGWLPGGIGWYRKDFEIPRHLEGKKVYIYFEAVYNNSEVFINGKWIGKRPNGYVSFLYDLTPYIKFGEKNSIAVKVDHSNEADSRWYTGSGIYRDVYLVYAEPIHIDLWGISYITNIRNEKAELELNTTIKNTTSRTTRINIIQELFDNEGKLVTKTSDTFNIQPDNNNLKQKLTVNRPNLWNLDNPSLYTLRTSVLQNGKITEEIDTKVGIRSIDFDANKGFSLNGRNIKIKGVCIHHDAGVLGAAVPREVWKERLLQLKEIGCNAIRMSHNPQATCLYELCDELGFLVNDEAFDEWEYPKKKWLDGWNVGSPGYQGSAEYFREWGKRDLTDIIKRDRNHPSIIMWSIGNEVDYPNDPYSHPILDFEGIGQQHTKGYLESQPRAERLGEIAGELVNVVKKYDISRPVTAALAGPVMSNETDYPQVLDIVGYNYTENRYETDHEKYPDRILYGSENGKSYDAWLAVTNKDYIMGQFIWTGLDYLGEAGCWPSRGLNTGMIDFANNIKTSGHYRKALWLEESTVYIGTFKVHDRRNRYESAQQIWNYENGDTIRVVCFTNCDEAEIILNDRIVGTRKKYDTETAIIYWDIPFTQGKLEVVAYKDGEPAASDFIITTGKPHKLFATTKFTEITSDNKYLIVEVEVIDENGNKVILADNKITCSVNGPLTLIGMENGSNDATKNYRSNSIRCYNGRLIVYLKTDGRKGDAKIKFSSPLLESTEIDIHII